MPPGLVRLGADIRRDDRYLGEPDAANNVPRAAQPTCLADGEEFSHRLCHHAPPDLFRQHHVPIIGLVENMVEVTCPHCGKSLAPFGGGGGEKLAEDLSIPFVGRIPIDPTVAACDDRGEPFITSLPQSKIAGTLREIGRRCQALMEQRGRLTLVTQLVYKD